MEGWPDDELEERAVELAAAAEALLRNQAAWRHRRVETLTLVNHEQVRRSVSVDFTVPAEYRANLRISGDGECAVPLALLAKRPLVHFDLRNEEGHSVPLLTAAQNAIIDRELLYSVLDADLAEQEADEAAVLQAAAPVIEAVVGAGATAGAVEEIERTQGIGPLRAFRDMAVLLSERFMLWAVVRGVERRRVLKFAYDEPFLWRPRLTHFYQAPGCTEAASYHLEVAVPADLKARTTSLVDAATGATLVTGEEDVDRPALYVAADPARGPARPGVTVTYGAERGRFLVPAAIVAAVITLLVAVPRLFADLEELAGSAGPAIALVLSTSAVISALVLRTDEHPLLRLMLARYRLCLVAATLAALFAVALLGFRAAGWLLDGGWALSAVISAVAAGILISAVLRSPSASPRHQATEP
jgi:hypothetical protein